MYNRNFARRESLLYYFEEISNLFAHTRTKCEAATAADKYLAIVKRIDENPDLLVKPWNHHQASKDRIKIARVT